MRGISTGLSIIWHAAFFSPALLGESPNSAFRTSTTMIRDKNHTTMNKTITFAINKK